VAFLERQEDGMEQVRMAFGLKRRCQMKLFEMPMVATSLVGFCFFSGLHAPPARADFTFGAPVDIQTTFLFLNGVNEAINCFSADGLEMCFNSNRAGGQGDYDLWACKRASPEDDWGPPENLGPTVNSAGIEVSASITADGLELYFCSNRPGGYGGADIYVTPRATRNGPWGPPTNLGSKVNGAYSDGDIWVSSDGLELYFASDRPGGYGSYSLNVCDLYVSKRATTQDPWGDPVNLGLAVNSPATEDCPCLSPDGLLLFFTSSRSGAYGGPDLWMTRRASSSASWEPAVNLGSKINGPLNDGKPCLAPDGFALYFARADASGHVLGHWQAPILPIVDFNGDGQVDGKEVLALAQHWGQNYAPGDIAPYAWGDGVVDANDLKVLAGYIGQEVNDPTLMTHWALDEGAGTAASDSAGNNNLTVMGGATWQPAGGKIGGALALDGQGGYAASAGLVLNPAQGPFSVIAWVKGGAPGQVILSQKDGANWLMASSPDGALMTDLKSAGRQGKALTSTTVVTDGDWHRVGFVRDGSIRILYVDDVEVARDTQADLAASANGLYIGASKALTPGTFWSGLIDDVRIYSRAITP
jgi:hypothetical protein